MFIGVMKAPNKSQMLLVASLLTACSVLLIGMNLKAGNKLMGELLHQQQNGPQAVPLVHHYEENASNNSVNKTLALQLLGVSLNEENVTGLILKQTPRRENTTLNISKELTPLLTSKTSEQQGSTTWLQFIKAEMRHKSPDRLREHTIVTSGDWKDARTELDANKTSLKKILFWNSPDFYFGVGHTPFVRARCPVSDCYITNNRTEIDYAELDAVVWRPVRLDTSLPPPVRSAHTRFVYFLMEPPYILPKLLQQLKGVVNYTMTFRRDSDIYHPYGLFAPLPTPRTDLLNKDYAEGKTKFAVWFASNCHARSKREVLVDKLRRYIDVDVYGRCGSKQCSREVSDTCYERAAHTYKFYFSFENSFCDDYITEKFFTTSRYDILPVVYGLGQYEELAPPHSYINALDFASIRHLADYLIYLDHNDTAYNEYFRVYLEQQDRVQSAAAALDLFDARSHGTGGTVNRRAPMPRRSLHREDAWENSGLSCAFVGCIQCLPPLLLWIVGMFGKGLICALVRLAAETWGKISRRAE